MLKVVDRVLSMLPLWRKVRRNPGFRSACGFEETLWTRKVADELMLREIVEAFIDECPRMLASLQAAIRARDFDAISASAHTLKGALLAISAKPAADIAARLEHAARSRDRSVVEIGTRDLEAELETLRTALSAVTEPV